jgi:hypothetical protein
MSYANPFNEINITSTWWNVDFDPKDAKLIFILLYEMLSENRNAK